MEKPAVFVEDSTVLEGWTATVRDASHLVAKHAELSVTALPVAD